MRADRPRTSFGEAAARVGLLVSGPADRIRGGDRTSIEDLGDALENSRAAACRALVASRTSRRPIAAQDPTAATRTCTRAGPMSSSCAIDRSPEHHRRVTTPPGGRVVVAESRQLSGYGVEAMRDAVLRRTRRRSVRPQLRAGDEPLGRRRSSALALTRRRAGRSRRHRRCAACSPEIPPDHGAVVVPDPRPSGRTRHRSLGRSSRRTSRRRCRHLTGRPDLRSVASSVCDHPTVAERPQVATARPSIRAPSSRRAATGSTRMPRGRRRRNGHPARIGRPRIPLNRGSERLADGVSPDDPGAAMARCPSAAVESRRRPRSGP